MLFGDRIESKNRNEDWTSRGLPCEASFSSDRATIHRSTERWLSDLWGASGACIYEVQRRVTVAELFLLKDRLLDMMDGRDATYHCAILDLPEVIAACEAQKTGREAYLKKVNEARGRGIACHKHYLVTDKESNVRQAGILKYLRQANSVAQVFVTHGERDSMAPDWPSGTFVFGHRWLMRLSRSDDGGLEVRLSTDKTQIATVLSAWDKQHLIAEGKPFEVWCREQGLGE